jgi:DNA adenine methylase
VYNAEKWPDGLYIEVKWQSTGGSVDEKYVFTALSMMKQKGDKILIIDGGGCRAGAILWMRKQAERKANRFQIFNMMEFFKWAKHAL